MLGEVGIYHLATYPEPEIGWMLVSGAEGRGIAHEAAAALRAWAYARFGWTTLVSYIDPANARSIRLAERLGARLDTAAAPPETSPASSTATPVRRPRRDRGTEHPTTRLTLRPHRMSDWEAIATFFGSDAARFVGGPLDRRKLVRLRRRRRLLALLGLRLLGGRRNRDRRLRRPGRAEQARALPRARDRLDHLSRVPARGYATEAALAARAYAYGTLGWTTAVSYIDRDNIASIALARGSAAPRIRTPTASTPRTSSSAIPPRRRRA